MSPDNSLEAGERELHLDALVPQHQQLSEWTPRFRDPPLPQAKARPMQRFLFGLLLTGLWSSPAEGQIASSGFQVEATPAAPSVAIDSMALGLDVHGISATLSNGDIVTSNGQSIERRAAATGDTIEVYHIYPDPVFPSLIAIDPTEQFFVVGDSSNGEILRIELGDASVALLTQIDFNFDGCFGPDGSLWMTAAPTGFHNGTDVIRYEFQGGTLATIIHVPGPSGPLCLDALGNLFLGVIDPMFIPGTDRVRVFLAQQLLNTTGPLEESQGLLHSSGWSNVADLAYDSEVQKLYLIENEFFGSPEIYAVANTKAFSKVVVSGAAGTYLGNLELHLGSSPAQFRAYQPAAGGALSFNESNYPERIQTRRVVHPKRPLAGMQAPPLGQEGIARFEVQGAYPDGALVLFFGFSQNLAAQESALFFSGLPPMFWALPLHAKALFLPFPVDSGGEMVFEFYDPGHLQGALAFQAVIGDGFLNFLGTTTAVEY